MKVNFVYFLHNDYYLSEIIEILEERLPGISKAQREKIADTLYDKVYELELDCTYDLDSGTIEVEVAK